MRGELGQGRGREILVARSMGCLASVSTTTEYRAARGNLPHLVPSNARGWYRVSGFCYRAPPGQFARTGIRTGNGPQGLFPADRSVACGTVEPARATGAWRGQVFRDQPPSCILMLCTSGWDTDCDSGNLGCLLGIKDGLDTLEAGTDWLGPLSSYHTSLADCSPLAIRLPLDGRICRPSSASTRYHLVAM